MINESAIEEAVKAVPPPDQCPDLGCVYAPASKPHPPLEWPDGTFCDGGGHIYSADGKSVIPRPCPCMQKHRESRIAPKYMGQIPPVTREIVRHADMERYAAGQVRTEWTKAVPGVILAGASGLGKTIAGHRLVFQMIGMHRVQALYVSTRRVSADCQSMASTEDSERKAAGVRLGELLEICRSERIVFFDDLGREDGTPAVVKRIAQCIDALYERRAPCVFTTNFTSIELAARYGDDIASRLRDRSWIQAIKITGKDARLEQGTPPQQG